MQKNLKMAFFSPEIKNGTMLVVVMTSSFTAICKSTKKYLVTACDRDHKQSLQSLTISAQPEQWNLLVPSLS